VTGLYFGRERPPAGASAEETELLRNAARQLREYLAGKRRIFELPLAPEGTPFQRSVWDGLLAIPYGETRSYGEIARSVGNPRACRAVGMANNRNPIPVFIPCHRVVGSDGSLVGYGGGLDIKERLLRLEGIPVGGGRIGKGGAQC
jgi:methylated-DNA-[protein]-cysteine S-methyltransferase